MLFAAERTLLAWNRTSISLMAFGFLVERFGLFLEITGREEIKVFQRHISFIVRIAIIYSPPASPWHPFCSIAGC